MTIAISMPVRCLSTPGFSQSFDLFSLILLPGAPTLFSQCLRNISLNRINLERENVPPTGDEVAAAVGGVEAGCREQ